MFSVSGATAGATQTAGLNGTTLSWLTGSTTAYNYTGTISVDGTGTVFTVNTTGIYRISTYWVATGQVNTNFNAKVIGSNGPNLASTLVTNSGYTTTQSDSYTQKLTAGNTFSVTYVVGNTALKLSTAGGVAFINGSQILFEYLSANI